MRTHENEPFVLSRDTRAVIVPAGVEVKLKAGQSGFITQALGGSFTLYIEGNLFRLAGEDADAIGKRVVTPPTLPPNATEDDVRELAWQQMRNCFDPEIPVNIVDLGLIYDLRLEDGASGGRRVAVQMTLTAPGCGMGPSIARDAKSRIEAIPGVEEAKVEIVWDPQWTPHMISPAGRQQMGIE